MTPRFALSLYLILFSSARAEVIFELHDAESSRLQMEISGTLVPSPLDPPWQFTFDEPSDQLVVRFENPVGLTFSTDILQILGNSEQPVQTGMFITYRSECCTGNRGLAFSGLLQDQVFASGFDLRMTTSPDSWQSIVSLSLFITPDSSIPGRVTINNVIVNGNVVPEPSGGAMIVSAVSLGIGSYCRNRKRKRTPAGWGRGSKCVDELNIVNTLNNYRYSYV